MLQFWKNTEEYASSGVARGDQGAGLGVLLGLGVNKIKDVGMMTF
jgi:hypothetical protein